MEIGEALRQALGDPDPAVPPGLHFQDGFQGRVWRLCAEKVGAGWFRDRFLYLFGEGLEALAPCLEAWPFLVPPNADRMIVGRNAYGAIAYVDDANSPQGKLSVLDPLSVSVVTSHGLDLWSFIGRYLPENLIESFLDDSVYREWAEKSRLGLELDLALAIKIPLTLGGKMEVDNFSVEGIAEYYQTTAPIYANGIAEARKNAARKKPRGK
jgi:hypothetical protein